MALFKRAALMVALSAMAFRDDNPESGSGGAVTKPERKTRSIQMDDGRKLEFGEKTRMLKDSGVEGSNAYCRIDFDNGKTVLVLLPAGSLVDLAGQDGIEGLQAKVALTALGHGLEQKLGDSAAGAESTDDALESVMEVAGRLAKGDWNKAKGEGGGSAKGSSELVKALVEYLSQPIDTVREMMTKLDAKDKSALRQLPDVKAIIDRIKAESKPSDKDAAKMAAAAKLAEAMKSGVVPEKAAVEPTE